MSASRIIHVVGIGADGWDGLTPPARSALRDAEVILGADRHLGLLPPSLATTRRAWPSPLLPALPGIVEEYAGRRVAVLASGDPMWYGIGATLVRLLGSDAVRIVPHASSISLACARLGWAVPDVEVVSVVGRPVAPLHPAVQPGRRVLVLVGEASGAAGVCALLRDRGYGPSPVTVLTRLGGQDEGRADATAVTWGAREHDPLALVAVDCRAEPGTVPLSRMPGLPEEAFDTDGQITKREIRAIALAALAPVPGHLLWDVGAGSGSVGIEWMRGHPACRAIAIEPRADRRERIARNATALGVPGLRIVAGSAPAALDGLPTPDAVFVGGAVSVPGVIDACLAALPEGGRLVADAVTIEAEGVLAAWHARIGGALTRIAVQRAGPLGGYTGWRPAMPVTQWSYRKDQRP